MGRMAILAAAVLVVLAAGIGGCITVVAGISSVTGGGTGTASGAGSAQGMASGGGGPAVPPGWEIVEQQAAATCPGLAWSVLAAIGRVESDSGQSDAPGVHAGANEAGANVIYRWDGGLWHLSREVTGGRGSLVSEGSLARGQGGGHSGFVGSPAHDGHISSVASGVAI